ncbi:MAG: hypothetical protein K0R78_2333 [Pelosinus sp.]|nr:hypothetical protein [Pelosinus sp.]
MIEVIRIFRQLKKAFRRPFRELFINGLIASVLINTWTRRKLYKMYGMKLDNVWISPGCTFLTSNIEIGDGTWIANGCSFGNSSLITIGSNCNIAPSVTFICTTHHIGQHERRAGEVYNKPITIGDGCWIGTSAIILPGVTIENGCIIGAGAIVTKDCSPNGVYVGNPAKRIRDLSD